MCELDGARITGLLNAIFGFKKNVSRATQPRTYPTTSTVQLSAKPGSCRLPLSPNFPDTLSSSLINALSKPAFRSKRSDDGTALFQRLNVLTT